MGRNHTQNPRFLLGAMNAADFRGRPEDAKDAGYAKKCRCGDDAWLDTDEEGHVYCLKCGKAR